MKEGTCAKTLAKIQARRTFHIGDMRRNVLSKLIEICIAMLVVDLTKGQGTDKILGLPNDGFLLN